MLCGPGYVIDVLMDVVVTTKISFNFREPVKIHYACESKLNQKNRLRFLKIFLCTHNKAHCR